MQSTTPLDPTVFKVARIQVTKLIGASPKEIVFLSGALDLEMLKEAIRPDAGLVSTVRFGDVPPMEETRRHHRRTLATQQVFGFGVAWELKIWRMSSASACTSVSLEPSYVLRALGVDEDMSHTSIRFGIGRFTTEEEIDKPMSPVYEMVKENIYITNIQWSQH
ncbi:hypothetical protein BRARA_F02443 [Brassica rapa]|uniref:Uncharacterized protein n=1 Tax=Brassica campestris TaxID=3711 RepID=A0A397Z0G7_BRACM|nr:hypothetical protein BRARA_F02443 [Brassica rapa]